MTRAHIHKSSANYPPILSDTSSCSLATWPQTLHKPYRKCFQFSSGHRICLYPSSPTFMPGFYEVRISVRLSFCSPSSLSALPSQGKTGGLARSRGFRARTMDTTRPPSKPSTLLARHVVRKRNFLGAFAKLRETDATRIQHTECGYIRLRKPRNKTRHVSRFLSFVHYGRSSVSRIQSPNRKSSASVGNRGSSKSTLSLELLSLIYIYLTFSFVSSKANDQ